VGHVGTVVRRIIVGVAGGKPAHRRCAVSRGLVFLVANGFSLKIPRRGPRRLGLRIY
jgi:hypothetical protein